jgi:SET domain-containing protein
MEPSHLDTTFLEIKPSPIHGLGVFAKQKILKDTKLSKFIGERYTYKEFADKYGKDRSYCYMARRGNYILCAKEKRNLITYINESLTPNVFLYRFKLIANRDIEQGEELFLHYNKIYPRNYELN